MRVARGEGSKERCRDGVVIGKGKDGGLGEVRRGGRGRSRRFKE